MLFDKFKCTYLFVFLLFYGLLSLNAQEYCGTQVRKQDFEQLKNQLKFKVNSRGVINIPVVVHVVSHIDSVVVTEALILEQIKILNEDFNGQNSYQNSVPSAFRALIADVGINFCLVNKSLDEMPSLGIIFSTTDRVQMGATYNPSQTDDRHRLKYTSLGGQSAWNTNKYLNIWVADSNVSGWATFPNVGKVVEQGVVTDSKYFGIQRNSNTGGYIKLGHTLTHEVGHFLGLKHIFGDNKNDCEQDDGIGDTPKQQSFYLNCPSGQPFSCGSLDMYMNFMDYTSDDCKGIFTPNQKEHMLMVLSNLRPDLVRQEACSYTLNDEITKTKYIPFPNPTDGVIYIQGVDYFDYRFFNIFGMLIKEGSGSSIDLSNFKPGCYILQVNNNINKIVVY